MQRRGSDAHRRRWSSRALVLILRGLFKKVVIADSVANFVNVVYNQPGIIGWKALVLATAGFAVQVYGDFSGYSDIARGTSRLARRRELRARATSGSRSSAATSGSCGSGGTRPSRGGSWSSSGRPLQGLR